MLLLLVLSIILPLVIHVICKYINLILELKDYPPGPFPLPIIGNLHLLGSKPYIDLANIAKIYGNVFSISFGSQRIVVVNTIEPAKEALITKGKAFAGRPQNIYTAHLISRGYQNIVFSDYGVHWQMLRKHFSSSMKMYGDGLEKFDVLTVKESTKLHLRLKDSVEAVDVNHQLGLSILNIISMMVFGKQYEIEDPDFKDLIRCSQLIFEGLGNSDAVAFLPWLRFFPLPALQKLKEGIAIRDQLFRRKLLEHKSTYYYNHERDLMDGLLKVAAEEKTLNKLGVSSLTDSTLEMMINDIFIGGYETTLTTLRWFILYLIHWPHYQDRIYKEIIDVVGTDRYPDLKDRENLHVLNATLSETLRKSSLGPLGVMHKTIERCELGGNCIPRNANVLFNHWNIHHDERYWKDPNAFRPERWLNENGKFVSVKCESYLPFSAGRRICIGKNLAEHECFLLMARLLRDFKIASDPDSDLPSLEGILGLTLAPIPFECTFKFR